MCVNIAERLNYQLRHCSDSNVGLIGSSIHVGGNLMLTLSTSLGVKLKCWYFRNEDEHGMKKASDLEDFVNLARAIRNEGMQVDSKAAALLKISHYNLILVRLELPNNEVRLRRSIGCSFSIAMNGTEARLYIWWRENERDYLLNKLSTCMMVPTRNHGGLLLKANSRFVLVLICD